LPPLGTKVRPAITSANGSPVSRRLQSFLSSAPVVIIVGVVADLCVGIGVNAESLAKLGYPGFAYMRSWVSKKNPAEVLLMALGQDRLEARVAEALPWVVMQFGHRTSNWLVEQARKFNLQNRLGFVVSLALQVAERAPGHDNTRVQSLRELRSKLDESRLVKEDVFYRPPQTEGEKQWLVRNRSQEAMHWNLLTDLKPEQLQYAD